jgi:hypothetical protein
MPLLLRRRPDRIWPLVPIPDWAVGLVHDCKVCGHAFVLVSGDECVDNDWPMLISVLVLCPYNPVPHREGGHWSRVWRWSRGITLEEDL